MFVPLRSEASDVGVGGYSGVIPPGRCILRIQGNQYRKTILTWFFVSIHESKDYEDETMKRKKSLRKKGKENSNLSFVSYYFNLKLSARFALKIFLRQAANGIAMRSFEALRHF